MNGRYLAACRCLYRSIVLQLLLTAACYNIIIHAATSSIDYPSIKVLNLIPI